MKKCPNCQSECLDKASFCPNCGTNIQNIAPLPTAGRSAGRICPKCGRECMPKASFCPDCGADLRIPAAVIGQATSTGQMAAVSAQAAIDQATDQAAIAADKMAGAADEAVNLTAAEAEQPVQQTVAAVQQAVQPQYGQQPPYSQQAPGQTQPPYGQQPYARQAPAQGQPQYGQQQQQPYYQPQQVYRQGYQQAPNQSQPQYGQQPAYAQQAPGQAQPPYGQQPYARQAPAQGQPQYGQQPPYAQPAYAQPGYAAQYNIGANAYNSYNAQRAVPAQKSSGKKTGAIVLSIISALLAVLMLIFMFLPIIRIEIFGDDLTCYALRMEEYGVSDDVVTAVKATFWVLFAFVLLMILLSAIPKKGAAIATIPISLLTAGISIASMVALSNELTYAKDYYTFTYIMWAVIPILVFIAAIVRVALCSGKKAVQGQYQYGQYPPYRQGGYNG